ncbi:hypothetical protein E4U55_003695 [Claviceps digitariae]|nr:hypothetical protein E4U55_003695 [Claviceps digitariae]
MKLPASPSKHGKALDQHDQHDSLGPDRLQIRIVPYSPPRLSTDASSSCPCPVSDAVYSPSSTLPQLQGQAYDAGHAVAAEPNCSLPLATNRKKGRDGLNSDVAVGFANATNLNLNPTKDSSSPLAPVLPSPSYRRVNKVITVNADKTFSLLPQAYPSSSANDSTPSSRLSSTAQSSSIHRTISDSLAAEQPSSPLTTLLEPSSPCSEDCTPLPCKSQVEESSSPWNYNLVGGLRKVPKSASPKAPRVSRNAARVAGSLPAHASTPSDPSPSGPSQAGNLTSKQALHSASSTSTLSETDYKTLTHDSPCPKQTKRFTFFDTPDADLAHMPASPDQPNIELLGESSPEQSSDEQSFRSRNSESNCNYVLHQDSTSSSPVVPTSAAQLKTEYSRESLVVAPLRPARRNIADQTSISRHGPRGSVSTRSSTSISSAASVENFAGDMTVSSPSAVARQTPIRREISINSESGDMNATEHQWNTTPSTVVSEGERGSEVPPSRLSHTMSGDLDHEHTSHAPRLVADLEVDRSESWIERPQPAYFKQWIEETNSSSLRLIGVQDEHGDGLAELGALHRHPDRTRLRSYLSSVPSDRNLRSAGSSHSYSFSRSYIPTWARLYYGGGERRLLSIRQSSESMYSNFARCAHHSPVMGPSGFQTSNSAKQANHQRHSSEPFASRSPRTSKAPSGHGAHIPYHHLSMIRRIRRQTSSIWSPHLGRDRRAQIHSIWRPPSIGFAPRENKLFRDRIQLVLFVLGFVFPFAWMAASFLPLPSRGDVSFGEKLHSTSHLDLEQGTNLQKELEARASCHDREKWWRTLNRYMSIVGVFVIGAVLALVITGTQQP